MDEYKLVLPQLPDFHLGRLIDIRAENHRALVINRKIQDSKKKRLLFATNRHHAHGVSNALRDFKSFCL